MRLKLVAEAMALVAGRLQLAQTEQRQSTQQQTLANTRLEMANL